MDQIDVNLCGVPSYAGITYRTRAFVRPLVTDHMKREGRLGAAFCI